MELIVRARSASPVGRSLKKGARGATAGKSEERLCRTKRSKWLDWSSHSMERFLPRDPAAFRHDNNLVCFDPFYSVHEAARPENFETIGLYCFFQSEVNAQIVLSLIARSGLDVARQSLCADGEFQARSDPIAVAFGSDGTDEE